MSFEELPISLKREIAIHMDQMTLEVCEKMKDFKELFSKPNVERIFDERTKMIFSKFIISFKPKSMEWREFYYRMLDLLYLISFTPSDEISAHLAKSGALVELKIIDSFDFPIHPTLETAQSAAEKGRLEILEWLERKVAFDSSVMDSAIASRKMEVIMWLDSKGVSPSKEGLLSAVKIEEICILNYFAIKGLLPPDDAADWAVLNRKERMEEWCKLHMLYPTQRSLRKMASFR